MIMWILDIPVGVLGRTFLFKDVLNKIATSCNKAGIQDLCASQAEQHNLRNFEMNLVTMQLRP